MANIELVIKIPEEEYINIKSAINSLIENGVERASMSKVCLAILGGTPLPKSHGRLIDGSKLEQFTQLPDMTFELLAIDIFEAPTVIEADKENEE